MSNKFQVITSGGEQVHKLVSDSIRAVEVSKTEPPWRNYLDYLNNIVVDALVRVVRVSLDYFVGYMEGRRRDELPLLELRLELQGEQVSFVPAIDGRTFCCCFISVISSDSCICMFVRCSVWRS